MWNFGGWQSFRCLNAGEDRIWWCRRNLSFPVAVSRLSHLRWTLFGLGGPALGWAEDRSEFFGSLDLRVVTFTWYCNDNNNKEWLKWYQSENDDFSLTKTCPNRSTSWCETWIFSTQYPCNHVLVILIKCIESTSWKAWNIRLLNNYLEIFFLQTSDSSSRRNLLLHARVMFFTCGIVKISGVHHTNATLPGNKATVVSYGLWSPFFQAGYDEDWLFLGVR